MYMGIGLGRRLQTWCDTDLTGLYEVCCFLCIHSTPVLQHVAHTRGTVHKSHVVFAALGCGVEAAIRQLQPPDACYYCHLVDPAQIIPQYQEVG